MLKWLFLLDSTDPGFDSTDVLSEATEMEYLRKVLFEYMMGRETKVRLFILNMYKNTMLYAWMSVI